MLERATDRAHVNLMEKGYGLGWGPRKNDWYRGSLCLNTSGTTSSKYKYMGFSNLNIFQNFKVSS